MLTQYAWYATDWTLSYVWCQSFLDFFFSLLLAAYMTKVLGEKIKKKENTSKRKEKENKMQGRL